MKKLALGIIIASGLLSCKGEKLYVKTLDFPEGASVEEKAALAGRLVPTGQQLRWQQNELTAFLHFGINTFTGREWGDGSEDPSLFRPDGLDCGQWASTLASAGFKLAILTAKHHDGFCLWPSEVTGHSVSASGSPDVVRMFAEACRAHGLKVGLYLSPWDMNAPCYGQGQAYNDYYIAQLTELLTAYGPMDEVWFDGANGEGPDGRKQTYDWAAITETVHRLQPGAVLAIKGDDVRWVGNENGLGRETEWSATVLPPALHDRGTMPEVNEMSPDLGSRAVIAKASSLYWYPSEVDVSIRPDWFYHAAEDSAVRSLKSLTDIYFQSVGMNSVLLLNIPPDTHGRIASVDSLRLQEFGVYIRKTFSDNLLTGGDSFTPVSGSMEYTLRSDATFNVISLQEDITKGQRVEAFTVEAYDGSSGWETLAEGTTIGYKRLLRVRDTRAVKLRVTVKGSRGKVRLKASVHYAAPLGS